MTPTGDTEQPVFASQRIAEPRALPDQPIQYRTGGPRSGSGRILLVDDDRAVLEITATLLSNAGYDVLQASSGEQALELLSTSGQFNFIITDYAMPGITGREFILAARRRYPLIPAVIMTGFATSLLNLQLPPAVLILKKPFKLADLTRNMEQSAAMMRGSYRSYATEPGRQPAA